MRIAVLLLCLLFIPVAGRAATPAHIAAVRAAQRRAGLLALAGKKTPFVEDDCSDGALVTQGAGQPPPAR